MASKKSTSSSTSKKATKASSAAKKTAKKSAANPTAKKRTASAAAKKTSTAKKAAAKKAPAKASPKRATKKSVTTPSPAKKKPAKSKFDKKFLDEMEALLHTERARYVHSAEVLKAEADSLMEDREPGDVQFDEESGEGDTLAVERERDLALSAQARHSVDQIDQALQRIKDGTYGICIHSGEPIPKERLRAIPWALERVEYKAMGLGRR